MAGPKHNQDLRRAVEQLQQKQAELERQLRAWQAIAQNQAPRRNMLAKTIDPGGGYPSAPCRIYKIEFVDGTFTKTAGAGSPTYTDRGSTDFAYAPLGFYYGEGAYIKAAKIARRWWILGGEHWARRIRFTLTSALAVTDANQSVTVDSVLDGINPGTPQTVYNPAASSNYIFSGANGNKGKAEWDDVLGRYEIYQLEC